jgi:amino acid transporter
MRRACSIELDRASGRGYHGFMSINDFLAFVDGHALVSALAMAAAPVGALIWTVVHKPEDSARAPWKHGYSVFVYLACIPGMFSAVLVGYALFFTHENLLSANALVYFLPLAAMAATLVVIRRRVTWKELPGFGRLSGLMLMIALSFALALLMDKTRIFVAFFGSIDRLFILVAAIFALLKAGAWLAFGRRKRENA